jgi:hypothetical protein
MLGIRLPAFRAAVCVYFSITSWPMFVALRHQQLTLVALVFITAGCFSLYRGKYGIAGVLLGLSTIKPQLSVLLILWVCIRAAMKREWRLPVCLFGTTCLLFLGSEWRHEGWVREWIGAMANYRRYTSGQPSLEIYFGKWVGDGLLLFVLGLSCAALWRLRNCDDDSPNLGLSLALVLALTVAFCPTNVHWLYNQVLLLPGCLYLIFVQQQAHPAAAARKSALWFLAASFLALPVAVIVETVTKPSLFWDLFPYMNLFLPSVVAIALARAATSLGATEFAKSAFRSRSRPVAVFAAAASEALPNALSSR